MPIHDVGYRRWEGNFSSVWLRWTVVAGAGIRLVWKSHWLRRMLIFAWLPTAVTGVGFFVYEQSLEHQQWKRAAVQVINWHLASRPSTSQSSLVLDEGIASLRNRFARRPEDVRHEVWSSLLLMVFFRYPQGLLMVLIVGIIISPALPRRPPGGTLTGFLTPHKCPFGVAPPAATTSLLCNLTTKIWVQDSKTRG